MSSRRLVPIAAGVATLLLIAGCSSSDSDNQESSSPATSESPSTESDETMNADTNVKALPLGDGNISNKPKRGYVMSCVDTFNGGGASEEGPWISGDTWNMDKKAKVEGKVKWPDAKLTIKTKGDNRVISGNGLPDQPTASSRALTPGSGPVVGFARGTVRGLRSVVRRRGAPSRGRGVRPRPHGRAGHRLRSAPSRRDRRRVTGTARRVRR